jgi:hypothetical protein
VIQIPIQSVTLNCLNVARRSDRAVPACTAWRQDRDARWAHRRTSGVMLPDVDDAIELGSAFRSAACFGWKEVGVADRHGVWCDADRVTRSLGRGAARRARNPIRVLPALATNAFDKVCVIGAGGASPCAGRTWPVARASFVLGDPDAVDLSLLASRVRRTRLEVEHGPVRSASKRRSRSPRSRAR